MEISKYASKYDDWHKTYNWKTCKTNREEYGKFLCSFLTNTDDSLVVNLNGSWGTGKTELLRRLYVELAEQEHAVIYIDAWESDFSNDALAVVCSELLTQLDNVFDKRNIKAKNAINSLKKGINTCLEFTQGVAIAVGEVGTATVAKGGKAALGTISDIQGASVSESNMQLVEKIQKSQLERVAAMKDVKKQIAFLAELMNELYGLKKQIVVLVDELDRCRPNYAIEVLEVIKHFFQTKGCVFLVATDTSALQHSICSVYGEKFKSEQYLKRFFDRRVTLSKVSTLNYLEFKKLDLKKYEDLGIIFSSFESSTETHINFFSKLFSIDMELRDIDRAIHKFVASLDFVAKNNKKQVINAVVLMVGIVEEMNNIDAFTLRKSDTESSHFINYADQSINHIINFNFSMVTTKTFGTRGKEINLGNNRCRIVRANDSALSIQTKNKADYQTFLGSRGEHILERLISYKDDQEIKYWLWDDYNKIIGLSGHIE